MPDGMPTLHRHVVLIWLIFVLVLAQFSWTSGPVVAASSWVEDLNPSALPARTSPLPTWFTATPAQAAGVDVQVLQAISTPGAPLPNWFRNVTRPSVLLQAGPSLGKSSSNPTPIPGEVYTYTLVYTVPAGVSIATVSLVDTLPSTHPRLRVYGIDGNATGPTLGSPGTPPVSPVVPTVDLSDRRITWNLADIANSSSEPYVYRITYQVQVGTSNASTQYSEVGWNNAVLSWAGGSANASVPVTIIAPNPAVTRIAQTGDGQMAIQTGAPGVLGLDTLGDLRSGETITLTVQVTNVADSFVGSAYDVELTDNLPDWVTFGGLVSGPPPSAQSASQLVWSFTSVPALEELTPGEIFGPIVYTVTVNDVSPGLSSLEQTRMDYTYVPSGAGDDVRAQIRFQTPAIEVIKTVQEELLPAGRVLAGEIVTYTVVYTFPQDTVVYTPTFLEDQLDDGLRFMGVASQPGEVIAFDVDMSGEDDTIIRWYITAPISFAADLRHTFVFTAQVSPTFFLGTDAGQAVPKGGGSILNPGRLNNRARLRWCSQSGSPCSLFQLTSSSWSDDVEVNMMRPEFAPDKVKQGPQDTFEGGGQSVRFELMNIQNSIAGDLYADVAYNVVVTDTLPEGWTYDSSDPPGNVSVIGGREVITWGVFISLPVGSALPQYVVTATPPISVAIGTRYTNTVQVGYENAAGYHYIDQDELPMEAIFVTSKQVTPADQLLIGDLITYSLVMVVPPRSIIYWPRHVDTLPEGVHYAGSFQVSGGTLLTNPFTGVDGTQEIVTWGWNSLDNTGSDDPLTATLSFAARATGLDTSSARVWDSAADYGGSTDIDNASTLAWNTEDVSGVYPVSQDVDLDSANQIVQPYLVERTPVKTVTGANVESGDLLTYSLVVYNTGLAPAYDLVISDTLPVGLEYQAYQARIFSYSGGSSPIVAVAAPSIGDRGTIGWIFNQVPAGDGDTVDPTSRLVITYTAQVQDDVGAGAELVNSAWISDYSSQPGAHAFERSYAYLGGTPVSADSVYVPEAAIRKTASVTEVAIGNTLIFTLTLPNPALGATLYNVAVTDTMPGPSPGPLQVLAASLSGPVPTSFGVTSDTVSASFASLAPGALATIVITARVPVTAIGGLTSNQAQLVWDDASMGGAPHAVASNPADVTIIAPDVRVTKDAPGAAPAGYPLIYTIDFENSGTATAYDVRLTDTLPVSVSLDGIGASRPVTQVGFFPNPLAWELGDLAKNEGGTIRLTTTVWLTAQLYGRMINTVTVHTPTPGDDPLNNQHAITTYVSGAFLELFKSASPDPVQAGDLLEYTLVVTNDGSLPTTGLVITDRVPSNTTFDSASDGVTPVGGLLTWTPPAVSAGSRTEVTFAVRVDNPLVSGTQIVNDQYGASAGNAPPIAPPPPVPVTVYSQPDLRIAKTAATAVDPGEYLVYTIRYQNRGNAVANDVYITETYDANVVFIAASPPPDLGNNVWYIGPLTPTAGLYSIVVTTQVGASVADGTFISNTVVIDDGAAEADSDTASTRVGDYLVYMPIVLKNYSPPPVVKVNLVVQNIQVGPASPTVGQATRITVTLHNSGTNLVTTDFWVDLYIDPTTTPTINVLWHHISDYGKAWFVHDDIPGGGTLVIHTDQPDDVNDPGAIYSNWPGWFVSDGQHTIYAQVDAYGTSVGWVLEDDETDNVSGPLVVTVAPTSMLMVPPLPVPWQERR